MAQRQRLRKGELIPSFRLGAGNRPGRIGPWDYKQRTSLVIAVLHGPSCARCRSFLEAAALAYGEIRASGAEVLAVLDAGADAVSRLALELDVPFPLLADEERAVRSAYLDDGVGLFVADRWNALFTSWAAEDAGGLPDTAELLGWLDFLDLQCEECHPPEPWDTEA